MGKSPYGGDRGGGRKSARKPGGQPGNTNARSALVLPKATDAEDRRAFLDAFEAAQKVPTRDKLRHLVDLIFARVTSASEKLGVQRVIRALLAIGDTALSEAKLDDLHKAKKRETAKDAALADLWRIVEGCEHCAEAVNQRLTGIEIELKQL